MADDKASQQAFVEALLQWDYAAMFEKYETGGGVVDELPTIGKSFASIQVNMFPAVWHMCPQTQIALGSCAENAQPQEHSWQNCTEHLDAVQSSSHVSPYTAPARSALTSFAVGSLLPCAYTAATCRSTRQHSRSC